MSLAVEAKIPMHKGLFYALIVMFSLAGGLIVSLSTSLPAWADCSGVGAGDMCEGIGDPGGNEPVDPSIPTSDKPRPTTSQGNHVPTNNITFPVDCADWNGRGSWTVGANCNVTERVVYNAPANPEPRMGYELVFSGVSNGKAQWGIGGNPTFYRGGMTCGPQGQKSAYAQNWQKVVTDQYTQVYDWVWNARFQRWVTTTLDSKLTYRAITYSFAGCLYPVEAKEHRTCFWDYSGYSRYSVNKNTPNANWAHFKNRARLSSDPAAPSGGTGNTAPSGRCVSGVTNYTYVEYIEQPDKLGYYSLTVDWKYRHYTRTSWNVPGGRELHSLGWTRGNAVQRGPSTGYWVYSCRPGGENNALEGRFPNQGAIPNRDVYLNPATCPQVTWQCVVDTPTTIGLNRAAVLSGSVSPTSSSSVMRNGEKVNIDFARIRIVDTSTPTDIDVTDGGTAPGVRNVTNIEYRTNVKAGSTPFFGTDPNAAKQYFKYFSTRTGTTKEKFGNWLSNNNANLEKAISFNWASDSAAQGFALQRNYRVTAEFYIPGPPNMSNSGSPSGSSGFTWKQGTYDCRDYQGRGSSRIDRGPLTVTSNNVEVVRSVNK